MQKVINGKRYDTDAATKICEWTEGDGMGREETALYRTAKGNWFIAGEGGPMSQWRRYSHGNLWGAGEGLKPVDRPHARVLLQEHGTPEQSAQYFAVEDA